MITDPQLDIDIAALRLADAHHLAPLLAAYVQSLKRGAPRRPDQFYAETLLQDRTAQIFGARIGAELVGFVIFYDLPDPLTGMRLGQVDHLYVSHNHRSLGIAQAMIDVLAEESDARSWSRLVFNAPRQPDDGRKLYERIATKADFSSWEMRFMSRD
ncbi:acetyltransferase (GNAT) family protein [Hoeflea marina]|uniref:Acetyltransferase (GNAT) family protein n=1 Tax=Hoeflea marina TaxID=274592 RepID=A0A317PKP6_9HYPH|nr:GNAT family N-acetyltransferase [Hoeflea marina]PWV98317.1 acetyltransferase (GNAT) family protein [Hoeflea marina]